MSNGREKWSESRLWSLEDIKREASKMKVAPVSPQVEGNSEIPGELGIHSW
jgi:hypothetical protein